MSNKTIENLPDSVGVWGTLAKNYTKSNSVQILFDKQRAQAKAFSLPVCSEISKISFYLEKLGNLICLNKNPAFDVKFLKDLALEIKKELDISFDLISQNSKWSWYYKNKDTALIKEAYDILNLVIYY